MIEHALAVDPAANTGTLRRDVLDGLKSSPKTLPCKYFYDERGSELFTAITECPEYYLTRVEHSIMVEAVDEMADALGPECVVLEFGSGNSRKTEMLLDALVRPVGYVPIDISFEYLMAAASRLGKRFPDLEILPLCSDYTRAHGLPSTSRPPRRRVVFFPGSTIGNFDRLAATEFLRRIAGTVGRDGGLLIGVDLQKDPCILEAAYNDSQGVTAAFNRNLLVRINRCLDGDLDLDNFEHRAIYNAAQGRVEMYLVSREAGRSRVAGERIRFEKGEAVCTEHSNKYTLEGFSEMAREAGLEVERVWLDDAAMFSVQYLVATGTG